MKYVDLDAFAEYLAVDNKTVEAWGRSGLLLREIRRGYRARLSEAVVNAFLAANCHGYERPPTLADLQARRVEFMTTAQAMKLYPLSQLRWLELARNSTVRSFRITKATWGAVRLDRASVEAYVGMLRSTLSRREVEHILGSSERGIRRAIDQGLLKPVSNHQRLTEGIRFSKASVLACLRRWIVTDISPQDWLGQRLDSQDSLMGSESVAALLGLPVSEVTALIDASTLHSLKAYGSDIFRIDPESVMAYRERCEPLTSDVIGRVLGMPSSTVRMWVVRGFVCPIHKHERKSIFYRWCLCAYLEGRCSPATSPALWISQTLRPTAGPLITESKAAARFRVPVTELQRLRRAGKLKAVKQPSGVWVYRVSQLRNRRW